MSNATKLGLIQLAVVLFAVAVFFIGGILAIMWLFDKDTLALIFWQ